MEQTWSMGSNRVWDKQRRLLVKLQFLQQMKKTVESFLGVRDTKWHRYLTIAAIALIAMHTNAKSGGKQPCTRDRMVKKGTKLVNIMKEFLKVVFTFWKLAEMREEIWNCHSFGLPKGKDLSVLNTHYINVAMHTATLRGEPYREMLKTSKAIPELTPNTRFLGCVSLSCKLWTQWLLYLSMCSATLEGHCDGKELEWINNFMQIFHYSNYSIFRKLSIRWLYRECTFHFISWSYCIWEKKSFLQTCVFFIYIESLSLIGVCLNSLYYFSWPITSWILNIF